MKYFELIKSHQHKLVLATGYLIVGVAAFGLGRLTIPQALTPEIIVQEAFVAPTNYTPAVAGIQSSQCDGKIKGSASQIYHIPGGAFYDRTTNPARCFDTEEQAITAGFRKSSR